MPSLLLPHSRFLHVPKTGGNWITKVLGELFPQAERMESIHTSLGAASGPERFTFAFVRHPLTWYQSYFGYKQRVGWDRKNRWDRKVRAGTFAEFLERVLEQTPGHYSQLLRKYVGPPGKEIEFIGRFERLCGDFLRALDLAGEEFDPLRVLAIPRINQTDYGQFPAEYPPELKARVLQSDAEAVERFYGSSRATCGTAVTTAPQAATVVATRRGPQIQTWAVGVMGASMAATALACCLDSVRRSGWDEYRVFAAADTVIPSWSQDCPVTHFDAGLGRWGEYRLALAELLMRAPEADALLLIQGDVVFNRPQGIRELLQQRLWPAANAGIVFLDGNEDATWAGWRPATHAHAPSCAAVVFPRETAKRLLAQVDLLRLGTSAAEEQCDPALVLRAWAARDDVSMWQPTGALVRRSIETDEPQRPSKLSVTSSAVSVVVPTWNCGPYLRDCLNSLLKQTQPVEVIVVDDASTDETAKVLDEYRDRIRSIRHDRQAGANAARNTGLSAAQHDLLAFADADNVYDPRWIEKLAAAVSADPTIGVGYCGYTKLFDDGTKRRIAGRRWNVEQLWRDNYIDMPSVVRRSALPSERLREGFRPFDDWRLWLDMARRGWQGRRVKACLYVKRVRAEGKTQSSKAEPHQRAAEVAAIRREFAALVGLEQPVAVVIPACGSEDLTIRCLQHLADFCGMPFVVHYVDNGSPPASLAAVADGAERLAVDLRIIRNSQNRGFTSAINQGIRASAPADVLVLNNDCFVGPGCVENLAWALARDERVAAVGPLTGDEGGQSLQSRKLRRQAQIDESALGSLDDAVGTALQLHPKPRLVPRRLLAFFCTLLNRQALNRYGLLDEQFSSGLGADDEWCLRLQKRGWKIRLALNAYAAHLHKTSFQRLGIDRDVLRKDAHDKLRAMLGPTTSG